jgi:acyl-CoA reductase-like NAD-dependent aldehyde dehydrogenase
MREEIFGPLLLPVLPYQDLQQVAGYINANLKPLGM